MVKIWDVWYLKNKNNSVTYFFVSVLFFDS